jgi:DNA-binding transcriptional regulator YiaG
MENQWPTKVKKLRHDLGITWLALAGRVGVREETAQNWAKGKFRPSPMAVRKLNKLIAEAAGI